MKKIGWFLFCLVPMISMLAIQIGVEILVLLAHTIKLTLMGKDPALISFSDYAEVTMPSIVASQIIVLIVALLIYIFVFNNKKLHPFKKTFSMATIPALIMFTVGFAIIVTCVLNVAYSIVPEVMEKYEEMMEQSGLTDMSVISTVATLILAPISEELVYRGITLSLAHRVSGKFWVANTIQALCFGIAHGNIIQGTYAFILGIIFGYIYRSYNNIIVPMICHLIFNFTGTYIVSMIFGEEEAAIVLKFFVVLLIAMILAYAGFYIIHYREKNGEENRSLYNLKAGYIYSRYNAPKAAMPVINVPVTEEPVKEETPEDNN